MTHDNLRLISGFFSDLGNSGSMLFQCLTVISLLWLPFSAWLIARHALRGKFSLRVTDENFDGARKQAHLD